MGWVGFNCSIPHKVAVVEYLDGLAESRLDLDLDSLRPGMVVTDVIPNPPRTLLIREAEARGCAVLDGLGMLVNQGVISIRHWTGVDPDPTVMRRTLEELFAS